MLEAWNFIQKLLMFEYLEKIGLSFENISEEAGNFVKIAEKEITKNYTVIYLKTYKLIYMNKITIQLRKQSK